MDIKEGTPFDCAPYALPLPDGRGLRWEDPRELHRVVVVFSEKPPEDLHLEYWQSAWPHYRLPKDRIPEGGHAGWFPMGDWFNGVWKRADTKLERNGNRLIFSFKPLNEREFPDLKEFPATYRTTYQIRFVSDSAPIPPIAVIHTFTDSVWVRKDVTCLLSKRPTRSVHFNVFNGYLAQYEEKTVTRYFLSLWCSANSDPNSFDKTLLTIQGDDTVTVLIDDLRFGTVLIPDYGVAIVEGNSQIDYHTLYAQLVGKSVPTLYDAIARLPEQTWERAWSRTPPKEQPLYLPLGTDGGRHKFRLNPDGSVLYRTNDRYIMACPGEDADRLKRDTAPVHISFGFPDRPERQDIVSGVLPIGIQRWRDHSVEVSQEAFVTVLSGTQPGSVPDGDAIGVLMMRLEVVNKGERATSFRVPIMVRSAGKGERLQLKNNDEVWTEDRFRMLGQLVRGVLKEEQGALFWQVSLAPGDSSALVLKIPYVPLSDEEIAACRRLDYQKERDAVEEYWWRRLDQTARIYTPVKSLDEFYRAHCTHLLMNCEREPNGTNRFARVGSFSYGVFGNESCMMIVDLDRRGLHKEARECLETFLKYQSTVPLPGDYSSQEGIFYGAHGYECGGYNQHHGWILWCLVEHYRFTRDREWLERIVPNLMKGADWIIRERERTKESDSLIKGLLPCGSLEDITDWWAWLSTNVYSWRGLDAVAWALQEIGHPDGKKYRQESDDYAHAILTNFRSAASRSPVVRLRDGTSVPHFPSSVYRRGRSQGWIREVLEGALHLLITRLINPSSQEALWILKDYEDNLYLSAVYGYPIADPGVNWFDLGGFSLQACLLYSPEPYLFRDDVPHALRSIFNAIAAYYYPDTRMITEHALKLGQWSGDHYKTSDEANAAGWLRFLFVREEGDELLVGQCVPLDWLDSGERLGIDRTHTHFGEMSVFFQRTGDRLICQLLGPLRNPPAALRLRLRHHPAEKLADVKVNGTEWNRWDQRWITLPGDIGRATVEARVVRRGQ